MYAWIGLGMVHQKFTGMVHKFTGKLGQGVAGVVAVCQFVWDGMLGGCVVSLCPRRPGAAWASAGALAVDLSSIRGSESVQVKASHTPFLSLWWRSRVFWRSLLPCTSELEFQKFWSIVELSGRS